MDMRTEKSRFARCGPPAPSQLIVYCVGYKCTHHGEIDAGQWADRVRLSDLEPSYLSGMREARRRAALYR